MLSKRMFTVQRDEDAMYLTDYGITPLKGPCWLLGAYYG